MISTFPVRGDSGVGRGVYLQILCSCGHFSAVRFGRHRLSISKLSSLFLLLLLRSERERKRSLFFFWLQSMEAQAMEISEFLESTRPQGLVCGFGPTRVRASSTLVGIDGWVMGI